MVHHHHRLDPLVPGASTLFDDKKHLGLSFLTGHVYGG
jgi:hypothetical protein